MTRRSNPCVPPARPARGMPVWLRAWPAWLASLLALDGSLAQTLEPDQLFEKISPSVWVVTTFDDAEKRLAQGSAVVIAAGSLITNCHVLAKAKSFVVKRDNVVYGATLEHADVERDLCQIHVRNFTAPAVELAPTAALRVGQRVYAVGNPRGLELTFSDGLVSGLRRSENDRTVELVQTTAPISPGSSGGGLFDSQGRLIGITAATRRDSQNLNFAMPGDWIREVPERARAALEKRRAAEVRVTPTGQAVQKKGAYFVGQTLQYGLIDRYTSGRRSVQLRVDAFDGANIVFNGGQRVESPTGRVIKGETRMLSELDSLNAIGGWVHGDHDRQGGWTVDAMATDFPDVRLASQARFGGESRVTTPAGEFDARVFHFSGFRQATTPSGPGSQQATRFEATAWYAPALARVVRFTMKSFSGFYRVDEEVVLERFDR